MNLQSEAFTYILKEYLKGQKDNINFILLSLRDLILEKIDKHNLKQNEIEMLLKFIIHGVDTYSFEKSISFYDYINLYIDISLENYKEKSQLNSITLPENEFIILFINNLEQSTNKDKIKVLNLNKN